MIRTAFAGLLFVSLAACASRPEERLRQLYDSTTAQLWRGELMDASAGALKGPALAPGEASAAWVTRFELLTAEIHLVSRDLPQAAAILEDSPTAAIDSWISTKRRYLQGQLALLRGNATAASAILEDAWR